MFSFSVRPCASEPICGASASTAKPRTRRRKIVYRKKNALLCRAWRRRGRVTYVRRSRRISKQYHRSAVNRVLPIDRTTTTLHRVSREILDERQAGSAYRLAEATKRPMFNHSTKLCLLTLVFARFMLNLPFGHLFYSLIYSASNCLFSVLCHKICVLLALSSIEKK